MRCLAVFAAASLLGTFSVPALAAGDCPDGDWFCEPAPPNPGEPGAPEAPRPEPPHRMRPAPPPEPPPPPLYPPPPDDEMRFDVTYEEPPPPRMPRRHRHYREWGLNLHALIGIMGSDPNMSPDADMNGLGFALRFRPIPWIGIEGAFESAWGTDYNGYQRSEEALMVSGMFYANPRSAIQLYALIGVNGAVAFLDNGSNGQPVLRDDTYTYLGGHLGIGVEGRVTRHFALGADLIGFLRSRHDHGARRNPEFIDPSTNQTSNSSGGGFVRLGMTFYW